MRQKNTIGTENGAFVGKKLWHDKTYFGKIQEKKTCLH